MKKVEASGEGVRVRVGMGVRGREEEEEKEVVRWWVGWGGVEGVVVVAVGLMVGVEVSIAGTMGAA